MPRSDNKFEFYNFNPSLFISLGFARPPLVAKHAQEHKGATRPLWGLVWVFIFSAVNRSKQDLSAKTTVLGLTNHCPLSHSFQPCTLIKETTAGSLP